jgi:outer membrane protein assembly factor BamB
VPRRPISPGLIAVVAVAVLVIGLARLLPGAPASDPPASHSPAPSSVASAGSDPGLQAASSLPAAASSPNGAAAPAGPLGGDLLIADRGNDRLLIVTPDRRVIWSMTIDPGGPRGSTSWGPDDAFFTPDGRHIVINEEDAHVVALVDIATRRIVWQYGHAGHPGSAPGYLDGPDDAYVLPDGTITVADIRNQRILFISPAGRIVRQYGLTDRQLHDPPVSYDAPNGDVPLPDGGMLVTEIGGSWVDRLDASGRLVWSVHLAGVAYPSDAQLLPDGNVLVVDYSTPGSIEEVTPAGKVVWRYFVRSGSGMLSNPSLAVRLPDGNIAVTNDFGQAVDVIDPGTNRIVWQYGHTGRAGSAPGYLDNPDGLDPVPASVAALLAGGAVATPSSAP